MRNVYKFKVLFTINDGYRHETLIYNYENDLKASLALKVIQDEITGLTPTDRVTILRIDRV